MQQQQLLLSKSKNQMVLAIVTVLITTLYFMVAIGKVTFGIRMVKNCGAWMEFSKWFKTERALFSRLAFPTIGILKS